MSRQFRLFRVAGINVYLHWSWFLVALYEIESRTGAYTHAGWNVLEYLALFAIVTVHEFGHALACRSVGGTPDRIMLWPFGGVAYVDPPQRAGAVLWTIAAGPLVNVALVAPLALASHVALATAGEGDVARFLAAVVYINLALLIFNILPIYPLDGGQILRALLWYPLGRARSLMVAAVVGLAGVAAVALLAARMEDLWLLAISAYIALNAWSGLQQARGLSRVAKMEHRSGWLCPSCGSPPLVGGFWKCGHCGRDFDMFAAGGQCPACSHGFALAACPECRRASPLEAWGRGLGSARRVH